MDRSPPVPTTSSSRPGTLIGVACAYIAATRPVISSTVSPLARSDTAKPAIWAGVASPERISPIAQVVWSALRSVRATSAPSTSGQVVMAGASRSAWLSVRAAATRGAEQRR